MNRTKTLKGENNLVRKFKHFLGLFNLTNFEIGLISYLKTNLPSEWVGTLDDQMNRFTQVDRLVEATEGVGFGHTSFYWKKFGKVVMDYPLKFPTDKKEDLLATIDVNCIDENRIIKAKFVLVKGFLFSIKYYSPTKEYLPKGRYEFKNFHLVLN